MGPVASETQVESSEDLLSPSAWVRVGKALYLAPRELELVRCICRRLDNPAIAEALGVTPRRVRTYLGRLFRKLDVHSRAGAVLRVFVAHSRATDHLLIQSAGGRSPEEPNRPA